MKSSLKCIIPSCDFETDIFADITNCKKCGNLLDVVYSGQDASTIIELSKLRKANPQNIFDKSGVWRFRELLPFPLGDKDISSVIVSLDGKEGQTSPFKLTEVAKYVGANKDNFYLQFEGDNPTGSFKDNGMAAASTHAKMMGKRRVACASTGNTSASMAAFAANELGKMESIVFVGNDKIAIGKLAQSLEYGSKVIQIKGDFDDAMDKVLEIGKEGNIYLMNSINPFRIEGQKTIMYRALEGLDWKVPDWIVVPGGNLGNTSSFGKSFYELKKLGIIDKIPRIAVINVKGANTFDRIINEEKITWNNGDVNFDKIKNFYEKMDEENRKANTICSAIEINRPVNLIKALRAIEWSNGVVRSVSDKDALDAKAIVGKNGFGCEPASATTIAGIKKLIEEGIIKKDETVIGILTGHQLKDPIATINYHTNASNKFANMPVVVENNLEDIKKAISKNN